MSGDDEKLSSKMNGRQVGLAGEYYPSQEFEPDRDGEYLHVMVGSSEENERQGNERELRYSAEGKWLKPRWIGVGGIGR